jgi:hypothetical protein
VLQIISSFSKENSDAYVKMDYIYAMFFHPVRLDLSAESAAIQQCFSLTTNQRTVLSAQ